MTRWQSRISLGDLVAAATTLEADAVTTRAIAELLGIVAPASTSQARRRTPRVEAPVQAADRPGATASEAPAAAESVPITPAAAGRVVASTLAAVRLPAFKGVKALPMPATGDWQQAQAPHRPLLRQGYARAVLSTSLSTASDDGAIDVDALIPNLAERRPIGRIPRLPRRTMRRGIQVLLDRGPALAPFARDQDWLAEMARLVGGRDRVKVLDFFGCPPRGGSIDEHGEPATIAAPIAGTTVLVMTDLGITRAVEPADRVSPEEWLAYADILAKAGCPMLVFLPYPPRRSPAALRSRIPMVEFDRSTTVSTVRHLARRGRRRP